MSFYLICLQVYKNKELALISTAFLSIYTLHIWVSITILVDSLFVFLFWISYYYFLKERYGFATLSAILCSYTKYLGILLIPTMLFLNRSKRSFVYSTIIFLGFVPWMIRNYVFYSDPLYMKTGYEPFFTMDSMIMFVRNAMRGMGSTEIRTILFFEVLLISLIGLKKCINRETKALLLPYCTFLIYFALMHPGWIGQIPKFSIPLLLVFIPSFIQGLVKVEEYITQR